MKVNDDGRRHFRQPRQQLIHYPERAVDITHEGTSYQIDYQDCFPPQVASTRNARGIVQRADDRGITSKIGEDLFLCPDMVARGQDINARLEKLISGDRGQALATGSVLSIGNDQIQLQVTTQAWNQAFYCPSARPADDIADY